MKKLYSIALAVAVALSASAQIGNFEEVAAKLQKFETVKTEISASKTVTNSKTKALSTPAKANAIENITDICGVWFWTCLDPFYNEEDEAAGKSPIQDFGLYVTKGLRPNTVNISNFYGASNSKLTGTVDLAAGTLTIKAGQSLGNDSQFGAIKLGIVDMADGELTEVVAEYNANVRTFVFPENVVLGAQVADGWLKGGYSNYMGTNDLIDWQEAGTAIFEDGWGLTCFGFEGSDYPVEVALMQDANNPDHYRLVNPYKGSALSINGAVIEGETVNGADGVGSIVFNVSDPTFVTVDGRYASGLDITVAGTGMMYCNNTESWYTMVAGLSVDLMKQADVMAELGIETWSSYADNVVNILNCGFGIGSAPFGLYSWQEDDGTKVPMTAKITLKTAGVNDALIADLNAPVEYFNLQGVRVANPENGLYIRRQGNKATKVYVK